MATGALDATGTLFKIGNGSSSETFATIPEVTKIGSPSVKFDLLEATSHDSVGGFKEYVPGLADGDNATAELWFIPTSTQHILLRTTSYAKTKRNFEIIFTDTGTGNEIGFSAYITTITPTADVGTLLKEAVTCKVTGQPTWT